MLCVSASVRRPCELATRGGARGDGRDARRHPRAVGRGRPRVQTRRPRTMACGRADGRSGTPSRAMPVERRLQPREPVRRCPLERLVARARISRGGHGEGGNDVMAISRTTGHRPWARGAPEPRIEPATLSCDRGAAWWTCRWCARPVRFSARNARGASSRASASVGIRTAS